VQERFEVPSYIQMYSHMEFHGPILREATKRIVFYKKIETLISVCLM